MPTAPLPVPNPSRKRSRFLHCLRRGDDVCLFHSFTQLKLYGKVFLSDLYSYLAVPRAFSEVASQFADQVPESILLAAYSDLLDHGALVTDNDADAAAYGRHLTNGIAERPIQHMYFLPTSACNLRCKYCFVEGGSKPACVQNMTVDTSRKALRVFAGLARNAEKISIAIYGGEPLCNRPVVHDALRYIRSLEASGEFSRPVELTLLTNGVLMDSLTLSAVRDTGTFVAISWDGPDGCHDSARPDVHGMPTGAAALKAYHLVRDAGLPAGISCTVHRGNIDRIPEIASYIATELRPAGMGFNLLLPLSGSGNPMDVSHAEAVQQLIKAFRILRQYGIYEDRVMRRVRPFVEKAFYFKDCMGVGGQIVVTPDGRIGPCQAFLGLPHYYPLSVDELFRRLPEISSHDIYSNSMFGEWNHRLPLNMMRCVDCVAISICGGGCAYASLMNHGSIWEVDDRICYQAKGILEWMIWETYDSCVWPGTQSSEAFSNETVAHQALPCG